MKTSSWKNREGKNLFVSHWHLGTPEAVIALIHGHGEHIGRYSHVAEWFQQHNIALIGYDQQGYGQSDGNRGHGANFEVYLDDIALLLKQTKLLYPETPIYLYGHSMGGNFVLNYLLRRKPSIAGLIATSPWIRTAEEPPKLKVWVGRLMKSIYPKLSLPTDANPTYMSSDPAVVKAYIDDPLVHGLLSAAAGIEILDAAAWLNAYQGEVSVPTLLIHGSEDKLIASNGTSDFANRIKGNITHKEFVGMYHETHNEPNKAEVFEFILNWMETKTGLVAKI
jgi:alpha-beta hydrolase superfamily lysophospholipase